jgi:uncharacterized NAD(P)/FAD-binding protein YdhS
VSAPAVLPEHVVFRELPFCGVLLDLRRSAVYRLSQGAAAVLRQALAGAGADGPYEPVISCRAPTPDSPEGRALLAKLSSQGLVRISAGEPAAGGDDGR